MINKIMEIIEVFEEFLDDNYLIGEAEMMLETYDEKDEEFIEKHKEDLGKYLFEEENLFDTEYLLESKDDYLKEKGLK